MQRDVFQAVADPTRREIIDLLAGQYLSVNEIAGNFAISRPAISKHLKILDECGVLTIKEKGRKRLCRTDVRKLKELAEWVNQYRVFWNSKLDALEASLLKEDKTK
ncbi:winged helix-turn-helix transcriptional regulator [Balneolaceae bacterium YR4-1]|uniref:Winged helix-turn-helix transcriptional regulator n=1 Tax=Halalkalibaculum roseum TaxID=2709311 RepID=A0A6M1T533_9BACT|nr:metalloregulator ArsR/SmtB family transcription factor [Halalkalibaculum roseum]NGP77917.1 winged helix-turn-helix transcriptional regulator [Halalkalibaculum roseum]